MGAARTHTTFAALADGGSVTMPLGETFWADSLGMVADRFGTPWGVNGGMKPRPPMQQSRGGPLS